MRRKPLLLLLLLGLATVALGVIVLRQPAPVPAALADVGSRYDVEILRDTWGVPHIFGQTDADVAYGLAFAQAEDDFETLQDVLLATRGRAASVYGQDAAPGDYLVHLLRVWDIVEAGYETLSPEVRALCEAYADGVNHYAALHPDRAHRGLYPTTGPDVVAGFVFKLPLFYGIDAALQELFADAPARPVATHTAGHRLAIPDSIIGSNAFAVAPHRTDDGSTFLAINSHQPWTGPVAWYEAHLHSEEGWDAVGGLFPGAPMVLVGHNRHLGWAHTVNHADLIDTYVLRINPDNPDQYWYDGTWQDLEVRQAPITVKLLGPFSWTFKREVLWSVHGPVVRQPHGTYALGIAGHGDVRHVEQWYRMNKATDFDTWKAALRLSALPMFNVVYADAAGNIHFHYLGQLPVRHEGYDWQQYLPGDVSETRWTSYLPFDQLPQVTNPPSGFVQSTNNSPFNITVGPGNPSPGAYSKTLGLEDYRITNRSLRARERFGETGTITMADVEAIKYDTQYHPASRMGRFVQLLRNAPPQPDADTLALAAHRHLSAWNLDTAPDNRHAALPVIAFADLISDFGEDAPTDSLQARLRRAAQHLYTHFGTLDVPWQAVNRLRRGRLDLGLGGAPDVLRAVYSVSDDDGRRRGIAGDSYFMFVRWDAQGQVHSRSIHQFGSATLDSTAAHYADQAPLFVRREVKPVWMDEADIRAHLERAYRPGDPATPSEPKR